MKTIIVIPSRLASTRFPNKPMALIEGIPMVQRVWQQAKYADIGPVIVACCEIEVFDLINSIGGKAIMTDASLPSGTDRIFEAVKKIRNIDQFDSIVNLQGDMPIIDPLDIKKVNDPLIQGFDIGTIVTNISTLDEMDINITKARINWIIHEKLGTAKDFYKSSKKVLTNIYHHVGVYSFRYNILKKFIELKPSKNEIYFKLEQWRAIEAKMSIGTIFVKNAPLSVDTKEDLIKVENIIKNNNSK
jgi:3-deoxy-manno-octulosonate cytidylyltransferase (CMP-KDO synthetase)